MGVSASGGSAITQNVHGVAVQGLVEIHESDAQTGVPLSIGALAQWTVTPNPARSDVRFALAGRAVVGGTRTDELRRDGLASTLHAAARATSVPLRYSADGLGRYPDETEEAVYFSVLEALQNVAKHNPPGTRATVAVSDSGDELTFVVEDAGTGFDPTRAFGTGLQGMRARVSAVGGRLTVDSAAGAGTRVVGVIPTP